MTLLLLLFVFYLCESFFSNHTRRVGGGGSARGSVLSLLLSKRVAAVCVSLQALEDRVTEITPSALSFIDSETPSEKLMYNITKALPPGQGA